MNQRSMFFQNGISILLALAFAFLAANDVAAASMEPTLLPKIQAATFEVVSSKPTIDPLTYDKPLPLESIPFQERNDKYYSTGTAFCIGANRYVTAAHVLMINVGGLWGAPALRDSKGNIYAIDKVLKFSLQRDFVEFSVAGDPVTAALDTDIKPEPDSEVFAVGNALGTGVVTRDGLYTSNTPEEQDGRWNWMRFSAAASPGNSGGPLLGKSGKVVGVVLRKSQNENLNYALPIEEVLKAPENQADIDVRGPYRLEIFDTVNTSTFKASFSLPLTFSEFGAAFQKAEHAADDEALKLLLAKEAESLFPKGNGSNRILHSVPRMDAFPALITRNSDGNWTLSGKSQGMTHLSDNGFVETSYASHTMLFFLQRPKNISPTELHSNPSEFAELLLKTGFLQRSIGSEKVRVVTLGKPVEDTVHTDTWQRKWQLRVWPLPYANSLLVTLSLPVPNGYVTLAQFAPAYQAHSNVIDLKALSDFAAVSLHGSLGEWKEYLRDTKRIPAVFSNIKIEFDNSQFTYASKRLRFSVDDQVLPLMDADILVLGFNHFADNGKVVWDVGDVRLTRESTDDDRVNFERHVAPSPDLDDNFKHTWTKVLQKQHPFDGVQRIENDQSKVSAVMDASGAGAPSVLYTAYIGLLGSKNQNAMESKLEHLMKNTKVEEH
jgi:serine protease Do